jgi:phosphoglycolate phosphatase-like HAD superfamily hydrolase
MTDILRSWRDVAARQAITDFVARVCSEGSPDFVPLPERIAVFDNDGTLWCEQPFYFQSMLFLDRVMALSAQHPEWRITQPFQAVLERDWKTLGSLGEAAMLQIVTTVHAGMTSAEFTQHATDWLQKARHPRLNRLFTELVYQPMLELLHYLRSHGFKTYIVSGGGIEFLRTFSERVYGIPPEQVVGSSVRTRYELRAGKPALVRLAEMNFLDDKAGKPVGINQHIGRRPIMAFGNSDGDFEMLEWVTAGEGLSLGMLLHHDDAAREYAYDRRSAAGRLDRGLDEAPSRGWTLVSMQRDWHKVFAFEDG